jgi:hypothetical protein
VQEKIVRLMLHMRKGMTANLPLILHFTFKAIKGTALINGKNVTVLDHFHHFNV